MIKSLGKVTVAVAGTKQRITVNEAGPTTRLSCHSFMVEALPGNTGKVYVGGQRLNKTTLVDVYAVLPVPTANVIPSFTATLDYSPGGFDVSQVFVDVDTNGEGVVASVIVG